MKPFNLEEYIANPKKKLVTRDGRKARIISTTAKGKHPIIASVESEDGFSEGPHSYTIEGNAFVWTTQRPFLCAG